MGGVAAESDSDPVAREGSSKMDLGGGGGGNEGEDIVEASCWISWMVLAMLRGFGV